MKKFFTSIELRNAYKELKLINNLSEEMKNLSNEKLKAKTKEFKERLKNGETLDDIRVEVFAVIREVTDRRLKKRPFDVQILGGLVLDYGSVSEMKTGEGKTIASIAPVYLNALTGKGVIVSTVNEYLAVRDATEVSQVHEWMGLSVGINLKEKSDSEKREAYQFDITYSIHSEIGFDYLRDNMVKSFEFKVQRPFNFALIDEVDSILIDEARTPLIVSGGTAENSKVYLNADKFAKSLKKNDDFDIDGETKSIQLTEQGMEKAANFFGVTNIFEIQHSDIVHRVNNALRANKILFKDADYIVHDNKILIVDAFTGRVMEGRSFSDGLHQALQAKENVEIEPETKTLATITYQNLFRMFKKLSGMTGTAKTEEDEFLDIYNMKVQVIPTNKPMIRIDRQDLIFSNIEAKYKAIINDIKSRYKTGQPVLVGTEEVFESERISKMLKKEKIPHKVLNAKQNEKEAEIISHAGEENSITIATNMAGRGTDIQPTRKTVELGGLYVLGTNKSEARRIDNQLKGRSGRQGDIGESRFYLSLDDKLISRFSNQPKLKKIFEKHGDEPIKNRAVIRAMKVAQMKIEGFNFDARKNVLQFDDVIRQQRDLIYAQRDIIISKDNLSKVIKRMMKSVVVDLFEDETFNTIRDKNNKIDLFKFIDIINSIWFNIIDKKLKIEDLKNKTEENLIKIVKKFLFDGYENMRQNIIDNLSEEELYSIEKDIVLKTFDENWQLHIEKMTKLRISSSMASYAQQNPYQVYVEKGSEHFAELLKRISHNTIKLIMSNYYGRKDLVIDSQE